MMSKTNNFVFIVLHIIAWLIFVGLSVEAGGYVVNFFFSVYKPELIPNLYQKLDITNLYSNSPLAFFGLYGFILFVSILKACLFYTVVILMHKINMEKPFSSLVASKISRISVITVTIGLMSYIALQISKNLSHHGLETGAIYEIWADSKAFILMGAVIYIIATIFKKGMELQNENDLTV